MNNDIFILTISDLDCDCEKFFPPRPFGLNWAETLAELCGLIWKLLASCWEVMVLRHVHTTMLTHWDINSRERWVSK